MRFVFMVVTFTRRLRCLMCVCFMVMVVTFTRWLRSLMCVRFMVMVVIIAGWGMRFMSLVCMRFMVMIVTIAGWGMRFMSLVCMRFMVMLMVVAFHLWGRGVGTIGTMGVFSLCVEGAHRQGETAEKEEGAWRHKRISHGKGLSGR